MTLNRGTPKLLFLDENIIDAEIVKERTQEDIQRDARAAKARAQETLAAVRAESVEAQADTRVRRDLREMGDVMRTYRLEAEADIEADRLAKEARERAARRDQVHQRTMDAPTDGSTLVTADNLDEVLSGIVARLLSEIDDLKKRLADSKQLMQTKLDTVVAQRRLDHVRLEALERQTQSPERALPSHTGTSH
jgi:hypothetical protein